MDEFSEIHIQRLPARDGVLFVHGKSATVHTHIADLRHLIYVRMIHYSIFVWV